MTQKAMAESSHSPAGTWEDSRRGRPGNHQFIALGIKLEPHEPVTLQKPLGNQPFNSLWEDNLNTNHSPCCLAPVGEEKTRFTKPSCYTELLFHFFLCCFSISSEILGTCKPQGLLISIWYFLSNSQAPAWKAFFCPGHLDV